MTDVIKDFFAAWQIVSDQERLKQISKTVSADVEYDDPRTPQTIKGFESLSEYVGMFSKSAPGWTATVILSDTVANKTRVTVSFAGKGQDGNDMEQLGQYFVEVQGGFIYRMIGFAGIGNKTE
jgi:uncharacterized protein YozE (UPF0346 family)